MESVFAQRNTALKRTWSGKFCFAFRLNDSSQGLELLGGNLGTLTIALQTSRANAC